MENRSVTKEYPKDDITVVWQSAKYKHAAKCVGGLPSVFKPREQPWIQTDGASKEEIIETVRKCPSGALTLKLKMKNDE